MKKLLFALFAAVLCVSVANARDTYSHNPSHLPVAAQTTISKNFKAKVSVIKIDKTLGRVDEYEVVLTDGSEITFDREGNWKDVEVAINKNVPAGFVPKAIADYVKNNQKGTRIVGIERDNKGYEVSLSNGVDMKFDRQGNFLKFD